jgi:thioesterase domain-containing protein/acyl carrier protein
MVPSAFVLLDQLPLTDNGKVDRSALPAPENSRGELEEGYLAPRNVTEQRLAQIWTEVLKVEKVGVHDNFFILGGHSLLAIRLLSLLAKEFEFEVPLRVFFESPTIAGVAKYMDARDEEQKGSDHAGKRGWSYLFKLKSGDGKSPVFVFPGGFGGENEALALAQIAHFVGAEYPFYGLRARSSQGSERGHESVEMMAKDFVDEIKSIQPEGPYYLLGHCLGGVVAYEVACQLQDQGEAVGLLGFLDTVRPDKTRYYRYLLWRLIEKMIPNWQFYYRDRFVYHWNQLKALRWRAKFDYIHGRSETLKEVFDLKPAEAVDGAQQARSMRELRDNQSSHIAALLRYRPRQFRGQVFSLVADQMFERKTDPTLGWGKHVSGGIKIYRGTGNHDSFIRDHTQKVGTLIRDWLKMIKNAEKAQAS